MPPLDASELDVPCEFDALMTDPRIKDVEVRPGVRIYIATAVQRTSFGSPAVVRPSSVNTSRLTSSLTRAISELSR